MNKRYIVPILTFCMITSIICVATIIRRGRQIYDGKNIPAVAESSQVSQGAKATILLHELEVATKAGDHREYIQPDYLTCLQEYNSAGQVEFTANDIDELRARIDEFRYILFLENENQLRNMTIDGREIAENLLEQIYGLCGMVMQYNLNGEIALVTDEGGNVLYQNVESYPQGEFHLELLLLVIVVIVALLGFAIIITRKRQILVEEGVFDGFDEEKYA